jgi:inhibitor of KinA sporulation pathway (predicted exonuclease)
MIDVKNVLMARNAIRNFSESPQIRSKTAIIFDLEFTAWEGSLQRRWMAPGEFKELVQIGAVRVDARSLEPLADFEVLSKPRINPLLSPYLEKLTGISNADIAVRGVDFAEAYERFVAFCDGAPICAFGRDDLIFEENIRLYGIKGAAALPPYVNAIWTMVENGIDPRGFHACDVARLCGASFEGREHDALEDARSVALGLKALIERGAKNPFAEFI